MKILIFIFFLIFCLFGSSSAYNNPARDYMIGSALEKFESRQRLDDKEERAQSKESEQADWIDIVGKHKFEVGYEYSNIIYEEPTVMKDEGSMQGVVASYTYFGWLPPAPEESNRNMLKLEFKYSSGYVDYENSGTMDDIKDFMIEARCLFGYVFYRDKTATIPYLGLGYRYLNDDSKGRITSTGYYGYERESNYYYLPIGSNFIFNLEQGLFFEANLEFDALIKGKQVSRIGDVDPTYNNLSNRQRNGYGVRGSLRLRKELPTSTLILEPFIKYWNIKKSEDAYLTYSGFIIGYGYEPRNNSTEYGLRVSARF